MKSSSFYCATFKQTKQNKTKVEQWQKKSHKKYFLKGVQVDD